MSSTQPLYDRDEAPIDRRSDLVLLLADQDDATYSTVLNQLDEIDLDDFPFEITVDLDFPPALEDRQPSKREPHDSLEFFVALEYVTDYSSDPIEFTEKGRDGAAALRAGLDDDQAAAINEVTNA
jgi:hypothetical protein